MRTEVFKRTGATSFTYFMLEQPRAPSSDIRYSVQISNFLYDISHFNSTNHIPDG